MKRFCSVVLAVMLAAAMIPNAFSADDVPAVGTEFKYDLTTNALIDSDKYDKTQDVKQTYLNGEYLDTSKTYIWARVAENQRRTTVYSDANYYQVHFLQNEAAFFALKLTVPYAGKYNVSVMPYKYTFNSGKTYVGCATDVYLYSETVGSAPANAAPWTPFTEKILTVKHFTDETATTAEAVDFPVAGDYYMVFCADLENADFKSFCADNGITVKKDSTAAADGRLYPFVSSITLTYQGTGAAEPDEPKLEDISDRISYSEEDYTGGASSVRAFAVYGEEGRVTETNIIETPSYVLGESCKITAPEASEGKKFLYWAKGTTMERKKILSYDREFEFRPSEGVNYLLAVYEDENAENNDRQEFYNANGQLLDAAITNGLMPGYPSMAGYGTATAWALRNDDGSYTEYYANEKAPETDGHGNTRFYGSV